MAKVKAQILQEILEKGENAKCIPGMNNHYAPEEYAKKRNSTLLMDDIGSPDGYLIADIDTGAVEMGSGDYPLKKIGRQRPVLLDLGRYTANLYYVEEEDEVISPAVESEDPKKAHAAVTKKVKHVYVIFGSTMVEAIKETRELPKHVKGFHYIKDGKEYQYKGAVLIESEKAYKMRNYFNPIDALQLIQMRERSELGDNVKGSSLNDI